MILNQIQIIKHYWLVRSPVISKSIFIDDQMIAGNFSQTYSDMRRDMMYDAMKAIFAKYGKTYSVPK